MITHYFLGSAAPGGFFSYYDQLQDSRLYIIKAGPGCGKSSFMRRVSEIITEAGHNSEHILCSADPGSLDAVIFDDMAIVDGTAPHVIEPECHGAQGVYLHLGEFYDLGALTALRTELTALTVRYKRRYGSLYGILKAIEGVESEINAIALETVPAERIRKRAEGIIGREIRQGSGGSLKKRFLSAGRGRVCRHDTVQSQCERVYVLHDSYSLSGIMLLPIAEAALKAGQDVVACFDPMHPDSVLEHLIIPGLSLGFTRASEQYTGDAYRNIHLDSYARAVNRPREKLLRRIHAELLADAARITAEAKSLHDDIELLYNPHVDFEGIYALAEKMALEYLDK